MAKDFEFTNLFKWSWNKAWIFVENFSCVFFLKVKEGRRIVYFITPPVVRDAGLNFFGYPGCKVFQEIRGRKKNINFPSEKCMT